MAVSSDEFRHVPAADERWSESWYFDVVAPDASWGMYARLELHPNAGVCWWWAAVVRGGEPLLLVRDHTLALPRGKSFEVRGDGLWADLTCHKPMERWQVNFEGIALSLDDPGEAYRSERGDRVPIEFEFEWESVTPPSEYSGGSRYAVSCDVHGEVQIGSSANRITLDTPAPGHREHRWGVQDWSVPWIWAAGALSDGTRFHGFDPDVVASPKLVGGLALEARDGRVAELHRSAATFLTPDGRTGVGWLEHNLPSAFCSSD